MKCRSGVRLFIFAFLWALLPSVPAAAHHVRHEGPIAGISIPAISHGQMPVYAKYRAAILDLAARQPATDPVLRRLSGFVSLQSFACFYGLVPGSLADEDSPFNECSHAYLAGTRALLAHMAEMPGDQSKARALQKRIGEELQSDPTSGAMCGSSGEAFDSAVIVPPDWGMISTHWPTLLTLSALMILIAAAGGALYYGLRRLVY